MGGEDRSRACKTGSPRFGWLCLVRSALALVVTVLAGIVLVRGLNLVLRSGTSSMIQLNVAQSDVTVKRYVADDNSLFYSFRYYLEATNPSEVLFISYRNITVELFEVGENSTWLKLAGFHLYPSSLSLSQGEEQEYFVYVSVDPVNVTDHAVERLFKEEKGGQILGALMVLTGELSVLNVQQSGLTTPYNQRANTSFTCQSVNVRSNTMLLKPSSENYKSDCIMN